MIVGYDMSGVVEEVGEGVSKFKKGDNVICTARIVEDNVSAAFQQFSIASAEFSAKIPSSVTFDQAASISTGLITAVTGLYQQGDFGAGLTPPWIEGGQGKYDRKPIVIFGGSGSVASYVIQLAKLSGFSPIIATTSPQHTAYLKSLGATHVVDRHIDLSSLPQEIAKITSCPIDIVFDAVSLADTQRASYSLLAPHGTLVLVIPSSLGEEPSEGRQVIATYGSPFVPVNREICIGLYDNLTSFLEKGLIQPNLVETLPNGLQGIVYGLDRMSKGKVSGIKLIAHPQETA